MSTILMLSVPVLAILAAFFVSKRTLRKTGNAACSVRRHIMTAFTACILFSVLTVAISAEGDAAEATAVSQNSASVLSTFSSAYGMGFIAAALAIGLSAIGAGIALAAGAPAAIGAISENPKSFGKAMIFVVLGEAVALYGFVIAFMILAKIPGIAETITTLL